MADAVALSARLPFRPAVKAFGLAPKKVGSGIRQLPLTAKLRNGNASDKM